MLRNQSDFILFLSLYLLTDTTQDHYQTKENMIFLTFKQGMSPLCFTSFSPMICKSVPWSIWTTLHCLFDICL